MSAVPQKKICWNCEGSVPRNIDNCSYCGVYLHSPEEEIENGRWGSPFRVYPQDPAIDHPSDALKSDKTEEVSPVQGSEFAFGSGPSLLSTLKSDLFPILFLMMGSVFFLFGVVLLLFSQNGVLTLQWQEGDGWVFLLTALPATVLGWFFLQRLDTSD